MQCAITHRSSQISRSASEGLPPLRAAAPSRLRCVVAHLQIMAGQWRDSVRRSGLKPSSWAGWREEGPERAEHRAGTGG